MIGTNVDASIIEIVQEAGFDTNEKWSVVESTRGRFEALSGDEQVTAQRLERRSTHRLYVDRTAADSDKRVVVNDGDYAGVYLVRFVDRPSGGSIKYARIDMEYIGTLQDGAIVTFVTAGGDTVVVFEEDVIVYA